MADPTDTRPTPATALGQITPGRPMTVIVTSTAMINQSLHQHERPLDHAVPSHGCRHRRDRDAIASDRDQLSVRRVDISGDFAGARWIGSSRLGFDSSERAGEIRHLVLRALVAGAAHQLDSSSRWAMIVAKRPTVITRSRPKV